MRILVCGGRNFGISNRRLMKLAFDTLNEIARKAYADGTILDRSQITIIEGEASGADTLGWIWAYLTGCGHLSFAAKWDDVKRPGAVIKHDALGREYDAAAGGIRNQRMITEGKPHLCVAFPGGPGTADMVSRCRAAGIPVHTVRDR